MQTIWPRNFQPVTFWERYYTNIIYKMISISFHKASMYRYISLCLSWFTTVIFVRTWKKLYLINSLFLVIEELLIFFCWGDVNTDKLLKIVAFLYHGIIFVLFCNVNSIWKFETCNIPFQDYGLQTQQFYEGRTVACIAPSSLWHEYCPWRDDRESWGNN